MVRVVKQASLPCKLLVVGNTSKCGCVFKTKKLPIRDRYTVKCNNMSLQLAVYMQQCYNVVKQRQENPVPGNQAYYHTLNRLPALFNDGR